MQGLNYNICIIAITCLILLLKNKVNGEEKLKYEGKGKSNEIAARVAFCKSICSDKFERLHQAADGKLSDPWVDSHQLCACWDSPSYRKNIENANCKREKDKPVYLLAGRVYTCNKMCKKYLTELTAYEKIQLREAYMCYAKMQYGHTATCVCDFKWA